MNSLIESIGVYLPERRVSSEEVLSSCRVKPEIDLEQLTGIRTRPFVADGEFAFDLTVQAAQKCISLSRYAPDDLEMVIAASISRVNGKKDVFSFEPSTASTLAARLKINNAITFDISSACAGMLVACRVMDSFIKAGIITKGLVVSGENITCLTRNAQKEMREPIDPQFASLTLGDSGAAIILEKTDHQNLGFHKLDFFTKAKYCDLCIGGPGKQQHGGFTMITDSAMIHAVATKICTEHFVHSVKEIGWTNNDKLFIVPHQTATRAIKAYGKAINQMMGQKMCNEKNMIVNLEHRGNTSSTSCFVALDDFIRNGTICSGNDLIFVMGASGITMGVAAYTLDDLPERIMAKGSASNRANAAN